jgi:nucleoside-diphosphate-sugar epimerase
VFVAGGTGVLGRRALARLVEDGHAVTAIARGDAKAAEVRAAGATPVTVDLFDADAVRAAVAGHEVVVNLATAIPPLGAAWKPSAWRTNARIRSEGAANLVDAALAAGATRYVQESIAFAYADGGDAWLDESSPLDPGGPTASMLDAEAAAARFAAAGGAAVVLRFGAFHAPESGHLHDQIRMARRGMVPAPGRPAAWIPTIAIDDAARAVAAALDAPAGTYDVVDAEPMTRAEQAAVLAQAVGRERLRPMPGILTALGGKGLRTLARSQRVSGRALRAATSWRPGHPSAHAAWAATIAEALAHEPPSSPEPGRIVHHRRPVRALLGLGAATGLLVGLWAQFRPRSFYDSFPGFGRTWVAVDGPYNEHLVRDVGGFNLAMAVVALVALVSLSRTTTRAFAWATVVAGGPHATYHLLHLDDLEGGVDVVGTVVSLVGIVVAAVALLVLTQPEPQRRSAWPARVDRAGHVVGSAPSASASASHVAADTAA